MLKFFTHIFMTFALTLVFSHAPLLQSKAYAGMITTQEAVMDLTDERANVSNFLARDDVKKQMIKLGIEPKEAERRLASLSDKEVKNLSERIDSAQAGGFIGGVLVVVVLVLLIVYLAKRV